MPGRSVNRAARMVGGWIRMLVLLIGICIGGFRKEMAKRANRLNAIKSPIVLLISVEVAS